MNGAQNETYNLQDKKEGGLEGLVDLLIGGSGKGTKVLRSRRRLRNRWERDRTGRRRRKRRRNMSIKV